MSLQTELLQIIPRLQALEEDALEVLNGPEDGRLFPLTAGALTIGRVESAEVCLGLDVSVSRSHARLTRNEGRYFIEDLGSTHGTCVNGEVLRGQTELKDGDEILIGSTLLRLRRKGK